MNTRSPLILVCVTAVALTVAGPATAQEAPTGALRLDPEAQPRAYFVADFTDTSAKRGGIGVKNLQLTDQGVELALPPIAGDRASQVGRLRSSAETFEFAANAVTVLWRENRPPGTSVEIELSVSEDGVTWERWYTVAPDPHSVGTIRQRYPDGRPNPNHGFVAGNLLSWGLRQFRFFRYRVTLEADGERSPSLAALRFFYQDTTLGRERGPLPKAGVAPQPSICDRTCWAARAPQCSISQLSGISRGMIHHTATETDWNTTSSADSEANVRAHQNFHMDGRGWCDVGYNFLVDKLGNTFEGREGSVSSMPRGAHDGVNQDSIGVALMGFLHTPHNQAPTPEMRDAAYDVIAWKVQDPFDGYDTGAYGSLTGIGYTAGHRDVAATACPGDRMYGPHIGTDFFGGEARDEVNARVTGAANVPCCPETPTLARVTGDGNGDSITVTWSDVGLVAAYHVYTSNDGTAFGSPVALPTGTTSYVDAGLATGQERYYKVTAVGSSAESAASDVYGATAGSAASSVLIVDGNDRWNFQTAENPAGDNHDFTTYAAAAMAGVTFDTVDNGEVENGNLTLTPYDAVVWMLGEESTAQETFSPPEQSAVAAYLDAGGKLFVSGAEIGWDLVAKGGTADQAFYQNYLKASYVADDAGTEDAESEAGGIFDGIGSLSFSGGPMVIAFPDAVDATGGSQIALRYVTGATTRFAGVSYDGAFRVVYLGFPFESVNDPLARSAIMDRTLDFLLCPGCGSTCAVAEDFEAGAAGWFIDGASTCTRGDYVVGDPSVQTNSGVTTQVGGSSSGTGSVFTASNTSAGVNDVDGGNCILGSPTWQVTNASTLSVAWWHGQRDAGDDASGDFFRLEYSTDGGSSWTTLRSNGDSTSNAVWAVATAPIPAGSGVRLRVQCSDGPSFGDLVECGIDDVLICE